MNQNCFLKSLKNLKVKIITKLTMLNQKLRKKLTKTQKVDIEIYSDLLLKKGALTTFRNNTYHDIFLLLGEDTMYTYPLFAFRKIYVQDWIPDSSIYELYHIVTGKEYYQKNNKLKYKIQKKGRYIDPKVEDKTIHEVSEKYTDKWYKFEKDKQKEKKNVILDVNIN